MRVASASVRRARLALSLQLGHHRISLLKLQTPGRRRTRRTSGRSPPVIGFDCLDDFVLGLSLLHQPGYPVAHRLEIRTELDDIRLGRHRSVSGNDGVEIK